MDSGPRAQGRCAIVFAAPTGRQMTICQRNSEGYGDFESISIRATMLHPTIVRRRGSILLAAAVTWLIAVMLCSNRVLAEDSHADEHSGSGHHSEPAGEHHDDGCGCGCDSFRSFTPQPHAASLVKAPAPAPDGSLFILTWIDEIPFETDAISSLNQSTGPPVRLSFAELVLQRCRHSHAPPFLT